MNPVARVSIAACRLVVCVVLTLLIAGTPVEAKRIALVIGNGAYKETAQLTNTRNDASDLSAALRRMRFEVIEGLDLDKRAMERVIRQFEQNLTGADLALFFFAGHGIQVSGQNHLVPIDARLSTEGDLDFETLGLNLVLRRMEREAKTSIVLLDACRDNPLARTLSRSMGTRSSVIGQGLAEVKSAVGTLISFSTQPGNVALDGDGRNSPYTAALLREIETPDKDLMSVLASVRGEVVRATGGKQVPWEHTSLLGPVTLTTRGGGAAAAPTIAAAQAPVPSTPRAMSEAAEAWVAVKDTTSIAILEAFIRRYGDTFHGDLAKARLGELKGAVASRPVASAPLPATPPAQPPNTAAGRPTLNPPTALNVPLANPAAGTVSALLCKDVLPFLMDNGAFGSKPIQPSAYAERVAYFQYGQIGRTDVARIARDYERKFPTRIYEIDQKTVVSRATASDTCQIAFEYTFLARNAQEQRSGRGTSEFTVRRTGTSFEVMAETGRILSRDAK